MNNSASRLSLVAACAGCAFGAHAFAEEPILATDAPIRARITGYVYVNARTGERTITSTPLVTRSEMIPRFINDDVVSNGNYFWTLDNPALSFPTTVGGGQRIGGEAADWGDIAFDSSIDAFAFQYATNLHGPAKTIPGLSATMWWHDCDDGFGDDDAVPIQAITIDDLRGEDPTLISGHFAGWMYTVDLAGSGLEFEIGNTDGPDPSGCDSDGDAKADFGWSYTFQQEHALALGSIGPFLVLPQEPSVEDAFDLYKNPSGGAHDLYAATLFFGGWPAAPFASFYMGLYGSNPRDCGPADFNADTTVDVLDFLDFINDFGLCENQPAPCGTIANADLGGDTIVDILDFLDFMDVFGACE
jgi:hypothetical protein